MTKASTTAVNWRALTPAQRAQFVRDLGAAVRVFQLLEDVGTEFLVSLTKRSTVRRGRSRAADAQTVIEELITELTSLSPVVPSRRDRPALKLVR